MLGYEASKFSLKIGLTEKVVSEIQINLNLSGVAKHLVPIYEIVPVSNPLAECPKEETKGHVTVGQAGLMMYRE